MLTSLITSYPHYSMKALLIASVLFSSSAHASSFTAPLLSLRVEMSTGVVVAGVEAPVKLIIHNSSGAPIDLPWPKWISGFVTTESSLVIGRGAAASIKHRGLALGHGKYPGGPLEPDKEMVVELKHVFPKEGVHNLKAILKTSRAGTPWSFWETNTQSAQIRVTVVKPADNHLLDRPAAR
jgi:hypothetical protein